MQNFAKRLRALESQQPRKQSESEQFLARLSMPELDALGAILERTDDSRLPMTEEERRFFDDLVAKYGP